MDTIREFIGDLLMILLAVGFWSFFVGVKVQCHECGERFYHWAKECPACGWKLR